MATKPPAQPAAKPAAKPPTGKTAASWLGKLHGSANEAKGRATQDKLERGAATNILYPGEVQGKEWDASRALYTTMGGKARRITTDDLVVFRDTIRKVQKSFREGIRARQVIDLSLEVDRERALKEIRMAVPVTANSGKVRFLTNAGPESNVSRHHVEVEFLSFSAAASAGRGSGKQMAGWLRKEPLKFDCDCKRHRYWYRYISTIGGFNAGRAETGFPKIRNHKLNGVACKHVLRVMAEVESSVSVLNFLTELVDSARMSDDAKAKLRMGQKEAEALAAKQGKRPRDILTNAAKATNREAVRAQKALLAAVKNKPLPKRIGAASKSIKLSKDEQQAAALLAAKFNITTKEFLALIAPKG